MPREKIYLYKVTYAKKAGRILAGKTIIHLYTSKQIKKFKKMGLIKKAKNLGKPRGHI